MDMKGEYRIPAPRQKVWEALNDPEILKDCLPGCESLEKTGEHEMAAEVTAKVGPVKAKFKGEVKFENINAPESYTIVGEGKGGVAGFAKGGADVHLAEEGEETILTYEAHAQVGGKLAQLGSRLIDSTARKMADEFFGNFSQALGGSGAQAAAGEAAAEEEVSGEGEHSIAGATASAENAMEDAVRDAEERLEVEAGKGTLGGPMVWGLIGLAVLIIIILIANM
ncbi:carbon monoxide dehydrogenase subunit G [Breoghania sp. JC706]|uniref:SRPBCC family protein n=1 Tax=Breoghania sp. JC706 TaxID=3117732 RepID=UPI00300B5909